MDCFIDYIGINPCAELPEDSSGIYINQLPGLTIESIDKIADKEQATFIGLWNEIQARALRKFKKDYLRLFKSRYVGFCCDKEGCDPEIIACANQELFIDAWLNVLGTELMIERLYTPRLNRYTTIDREHAAELKDYYQVEYEKALEDGISNIPKQTIDECFECTGSIARVETLP